MDESSCLVLYRCEGRERQGQQLGIRDGQSEWPDAVGLDQEFDETRRCCHSGRQPRQGWKQSRECPVRRPREHGAEVICCFEPARTVVMKARAAAIAVLIAGSSSL